MAIPKIIHYCWFGNSQKPLDIQKYLTQFGSILNDYKIMEWNDSNFDFSHNKYAKINYENKKYAFVSDYARLKVLYEYGGIYLDTDVEVKKKFDPMLNHKMFIGFMFDCNLGTAVIGVEKCNNVIKKMIDLYEDKEIKDSPNNGMFTTFFLDNFSDFKLNGRYQELSNDITVYPKEFFEQPTFNKKMGYSVHHFKGSWYNKKDSKFKKMMKLFLGNVFYKKISHYRALKISPYYQIYLNHSKRL